MLYIFFKELDRTDEVPPDTIIKRGTLKLINTENKRLSRVFTQSDDKSALLNIGRVACREFNFDNVNDVSALAVNNLRSQFSSDQEYLSFVNEQSLTDVECDGTETGIKTCRSKPTATLKTTLYELEVECLCE